MRETSDRQRPEPPRIADGDHPVGGEHDKAVGALPGGQRAFEPFLPRRAAGGGEHQREHLGVAGRGQPEATPQQLVAQLGGVDDVAVVGERERAVHGFDEERLDVAFVARTGGRVPRVSDGVVADERRERLRAEDVGDETRLLVDPDALAVADRDPGGFLPPVLEREQPEERELGDAVAVWRRGREHAAFVAGSIECSVGHERSSLHGVGLHGVGLHGVGLHGVGLHGVGSHGVGSGGLGSAEAK